MNLELSMRADALRFGDVDKNAGKNSGPTVFPCVFVNITEPQRVSAHTQFKIHVSRIPPFFLQCRPPHGAVGDVLDF